MKKSVFSVKRKHVLSEQKMSELTFLMNNLKRNTLHAMSMITI